MLGRAAQRGHITDHIVPGSYEISLSGCTDHVAHCLKFAHLGYVGVTIAEGLL